MVLKILIFSDYTKGSKSKCKRWGENSAVNHDIHNRLCIHKFDLKIYFIAQVSEKIVGQGISFRSFSYGFCDHRHSFNLILPWFLHLPWGYDTRWLPFYCLFLMLIDTNGCKCVSPNNICNKMSLAYATKVLKSI